MYIVTGTQATISSVKWIRYLGMIILEMRSAGIIKLINDK